MPPRTPKEIRIPPNGLRIQQVAWGPDGASDVPPAVDATDRVAPASAGWTRSDPGRSECVQCVVTYLALAWLGVQGIGLAAEAWQWSPAIEWGLAAVLGATAFPLLAVALVRSRDSERSLWGPEIAIVVLTLAGLTLGVRLAAIVTS